MSKTLTQNNIPEAAIVILGEHLVNEKFKAMSKKTKKIFASKLDLG